MNLGNLSLLKQRFSGDPNSRNIDDLIDTLAAINVPPSSTVQAQIPFIPSNVNSGTGVVAVAHGLGAVPSTINAGIQVIPGQSDLGWGPGVVVYSSNVVLSVGGMYVPALGVTADASYVYIVQSSPASSFEIFNNTTASPVLSAITPAKWAYYVYASLDYIATQPNLRIIIQPASISVAAPGSVMLTVGAVGTPTLLYQWQVSSNQGASWSAASGGVYSGNTTNTLTISNSTGLNGCLYQCIITNGLAQSVTTNIVTLTVT